MFRHELTQVRVYAGLISFAGGLQPSQNIRIRTDGYALLLRPVELANHCIGGELVNLGDDREIDLSVGSLGKA